MMEKTAKIYVAGHRGMVGSAIVRALERQGLAEMGGAARYGSFGQLAVMAHLAPALIARG